MGCFSFRIGRLSVCMIVKAEITELNRPGVRLVVSAAERGYFNPGLEEDSDSSLVLL